MTKKVISVEIRGCLSCGKVLRYAWAKEEFSRKWEKFYSMKALKSAFSIKKLKKTDEMEVAHGPKKIYAWPVYHAEIEVVR